MGYEGFSSAVEAQHLRIDRANYENVFIVGDVHGCRATLDALLSRLDPSADDLVILVGDLVRRGPDTRGVIDLVRSRPNLRSIRGNNEEKLILGRRTVSDITPEDIRWLRSLPIVISWPGHIVVHAGLDPRTRRDQLTVPALQNTDSIAESGDGPPYWWERFDGNDRVFFGHTVLERPLVTETLVGLDTGCVYGGCLSAYDCENDRVIDVEPPRTHKDRPARKFISPHAEASIP